MTTFTEHETAFINATAFHIERDWKGRKGIFADKAGISGGYLSEIIGRKKCPQLDKQEKIAKELGYKNVFEFVEFGKNLTLNDLVGVMPKFQMPQQPSDPSPNILDGRIAVYGDCSKCLSLQDEATKRHRIVIEGFQDRELAIKFNEALVEIESLEPSDFQELYENALTKLRKLREKKGIVQQEKKTVNQ